MKFKLITDHADLENAFRKKDVHGRLARWLDLIAEYDFEIKYRKGSENGPSDYLSRIHESSESEEEELEGDHGPAGALKDSEVVGSIIDVACANTEEELSQIRCFLEDGIPRSESKEYTVQGSGGLPRNLCCGTEASYVRSLVISELCHPRTCTREYYA